MSDNALAELNDTAKDLFYAIASGVGLIWFQGYEYDRMSRTLATALDAIEPRPRHLAWNEARGLHDKDDKFEQILVSSLPNDDVMTIRQFRKVNAQQNAFASQGNVSSNPVAHEKFLLLENFSYDEEVGMSDALRIHASADQPVVVVLEDFDKKLKEKSLTTSKLKQRVREYQSRGCSALVIMTTCHDIPEDLTKDATFIEMPLPKQHEFEPVLHNVLVNLKEDQDVPDDDPKFLKDCEEFMAPHGRDKILKSLLGLTSKEAEDILSKCASRDKHLDPRKIGKEKANKLAMGGLIEYIDTGETIGDFGGYTRLKNWIFEIVSTLCKAARIFGAEDETGVLLAGPPGTGKTFFAQLIATILGVPCVIAHFERCYGKYLGETNQKLRRMLASCKAMSPVVVIYDEVEKLLGGSHGQTTDGGASQRALATLLTDMTKPVPGMFLSMTTNDPSKLPPPLLRRVGKVFEVGIPHYEDAFEILNIHLDKRVTEPNGIGDLSEDDRWEIACRLEGFSGHDIMKLTKNSIRRAFVREQKVTKDLIMEVAGENPPTAVIYEDELRVINAWIKKGGIENAAAEPTRPKWEPNVQIQNRSVYKPRKKKAS